MSEPKRMRIIILAVPIDAKLSGHKDSRWTHAIEIRRRDGQWERIGYAEDRPQAVRVITDLLGGKIDEVPISSDKRLN